MKRLSKVPEPPEPKRRLVTRDEKARRRKFFEHVMGQGWDEDQIALNAKALFGMGPRACRKLMAEVARKWTERDEAVGDGARRQREASRLDEVVRQLMYYPATDRKGAEHPRAHQERHPDDVEWGLVLRALTLRAHVDAGQRGGAAGGALGVNVADEEASELVGDDEEPHCPACGEPEAFAPSGRYCANQKCREFRDDGTTC